MDQRPLNINPLSIHLPLNAWVSILHRISGVFLALSLPLVLLAFSCSLDSPDSFARVVSYSQSIWGGLLLWMWLTAWCYHVLAGVRHMLMDLHWGMGLKQATCSSALVLLLTLLGSASLAWCLWLAEVLA